MKTRKHAEFSTDKTLTLVATANFVLAGPTSGSPAASAFRALVAADIPSLSAIYQPLNANLTTWAGITPGTNVGTALAVNVGTAGAFVVNGGGLGTPSSGNLANCIFPTLNQNTTGSAATLTTTRTIWGQNFNGSANVSGTLALGVSDLTLTGSIGATGARVTKVWTAALESTAMPTVGGTSLSSTFSPIAGSASIVTVGTIATGTWSATAIAANKGGTGQTTYAVGDLLYASTTSALSKLADVATGNALISGGVNTAPSWGKIALTTHVSGTLPVANGGTGDTGAAWTGYTPTVTAGAGTPTTVTATGKYKKIGRVVHFQHKVTVTDKGTASGAMIVTLPFTSDAANAWMFMGYESAATGALTSGVIITSVPDKAQMTRVDAGALWVNTYVFNLNGTYESTT